MEAEGTLVAAQEWGVTAHGDGFCCGDENVLNVVAVVVAHICEYTENYFLWVSFMVCELDLNNTVKPKSSGTLPHACSPPWFC